MTSAREELLKTLQEGLSGGFCLDWQVDGMSRAWPGAALQAWAWRLQRRWRRRLPPRSRIVLSLPNSPAYLAHWLAVWQGDWIHCPLPPLPAPEQRRRIASLRPVLVITWEAGQLRETWREPSQAESNDPPDMASIFWSSGSMGQGRAYGLTYAALLWQWRQHREALGLSRDSLVRNTLPWSHCFAGVLELLPVLQAGAVLRVASLGEIRQESFSHLLTVPRVAKLLGPKQRQGLHGGIVGGAPIDANLAQDLQGTPLRVGFGQTEAGPGLTLGHPGIFTEGGVGDALPDLEYQVTKTLRYRSPGQAWGRWCLSGWEPVADQEGWIDSGDRLVSAPAGAWRWVGREDANFKLANGQAIQPEPTELQLQSRYPALQQIILGAPGSRHLTALATMDPADVAALRRGWRESYPLYLLSPEAWKTWQSPAGKTRRSVLYAEWPRALAQAARL